MRKWIKLFEMLDDLALYTSAYMRGMGASGHPDTQHHHDEYEWRLEKAYPIANLNPEVDKVAWMKHEIEIWSSEGQPNRYDDEIAGPIREPIIVVEINGVGEIVDGWHRTGGSALAGRDTIPAVVGILKT